VTRVERYEQRTGDAVMALAITFIVVYAIPILWADPSDRLLSVCQAANLMIWALFAMDLVIRVWLAEQRWRYLAAHPIDVVTVLLPALRPLRVLRVFSAGQALFSRGAGMPLLRTTQAIAVSAATLMFISALAVLDAERGAPDANITDFGDAIWWAGTTVTTVGYGDRFPVTGTGRAVAFALMLVGISLLGVVTATVAAWFIARTSQTAEDETEALEERIVGLERQLAEIHAAVTGTRAYREGHG
jgi:voltage-gated potassium channel